MARKPATIIPFARPDLIPSHLKPVAVIVDNNGKGAYAAEELDVIFYNPGDTLPNDMIVLGGILYSLGDTIPDNLKLVNAFMGQGSSTPGLNDGFAGSAVDTDIWTPIDTQTGNPHITVSAGNLVIAAPPGEDWALTALVSKPPYVWVRRAGLTIEWQVTPGDSTTFKELGFTDGSLIASAVEAHAFQLYNTASIYVMFDTGGGAALVPITYTATSLWLRIVCKATGAHYYISTDNRATWILIWVDSTVTTTPLYAFIESYDAALTSSGVRVYQGTVRTPLTIAAPTIMPSVGAELLTDPGLEGTYTDGLCAALTKTLTPTLAQSADSHGGSKAQSLTATQQFDAVGQSYNSGIIGAWYVASAWGKRTAGTGGTNRFVASHGIITVIGPAITAASYVQNTLAFRASGDALNVYPSSERNTSSFDTVIVDDMSLMALTLSSLLSANTPAGRQGIWDCSPTISAGYQSGMLFNYDGATTDAALDTMFAYVDPTRNIHVMGKVIAGVWTESIAATAYSAGVQIRAIRVDDATNMRVAMYKADAQVGTTQVYVLADHATIKDNTGFCALQTVASDGSNTPGDLVYNGGIGVA